MPKPDPIPGVSSGMEYLVDLNKILVHQQVEVAELLSGQESCNKYVILNTLGQQIYFAHEESSPCCRMCCGNERSFVMHLFENSGIEAIRLRRNYKCCAKCAWCTCMPCCVEEISVEAPVGEIIGYCRQGCSFISPKLEVQNKNNELMYSMRGPMCFCQNNCCRKDVNFSIKDTNRNIIGKISNEWSATNRERHSDADNYSVTFPYDCEAEMKAVLLAIMFLIVSSSNKLIYSFIYYSN
ncbi:hypothetical protein HELRODRAFT_87707 [Helobdella robusta]|uniref:Phospholipid scramblase n=1 Tax=Helobdella robusta TaxID=6412 RepID=T1G6U6_HELRO|nr:hypothetical protein HELRODRAFT_87707 [Helobdella robusta]ESN94034.1 hypothetical protein HELRODRAFT_87707 [Helobdella robusta]